MNAIFITKTVFFVGTSLTDPDIINLLKQYVNLLPEKDFILPFYLKKKQMLRLHWQNFFGVQLIRYRATKGHLKIDSFLKIKILLMFTW